MDISTLWHANKLPALAGVPSLFSVEPGYFLTTDGRGLTRINTGWRSFGLDANDEVFFGRKSARMGRELEL
jgi:hypothetical protein